MAAACDKEQEQESVQLEPFPNNFNGFTNFTRPIPIIVPPIEGGLFANDECKVIKQETSLLAKLPRNRELFECNDDVEKKKNTSKDKQKKGGLSPSIVKGSKQKKSSANESRRVTRQKRSKKRKKEIIDSDDDDFM